MYSQAERRLRDAVITFEAARRRETTFQQTLESAFNRIVEGNRDAIDALTYATRAFANALGDDFELADEEDYVATDPISFDELMGGMGE